MVVSGKSSARKRKQLAAASIAVALLVILLLIVLLKTMGGKGHNSPGKMSSPVIAETIPPQNPKQTAPVETAAANKQKPLVATATAAEKPLAENRAGTQPVQDQPQPPAKAVAEPQPVPAKPQQPLAAPVTPPANQTLANQPPASPQAAPVSFPPPGNIHITLEERLADVQEKIALLEKDIPARTQKNHKDQVNKVLDLASNTAYLSKRFNDFRMTVYQAQLIRIQAQIKRMNYAMDLDESQFSAQATKEFAESFAQYTKEHRDWGYNRRDMDYTAKMLDSLKSKTINPNVEVVDSTYPQYSGPLLFTLTSDRIQRHRELVLELLKLGANANKVVNTKKVDFPRHPEDQLILTEGGIDRLDNYLIPLLQNVNTYHKEERLAIIRDLILLNHDLLEVDHKGEIGRAHV